MISKLDICREVVEGYKHKKVRDRDGRMFHLDAQTAQGILLLVNRLSLENTEKLLSWSWEKIANFAWADIKLKVV